MPQTRTLKKNLKSRSSKRAKPRPKRAPLSKTTAIVKVDPPTQITHWRERTLSKEKVELLKRTVAKGTDDDQFALFLNVCQRHGLDPFVKQVYCVLFPIAKHHKDEKDIWVAGHEMVIITGIGGYRKMAARDHKDFAGSSEGKFTWFEPARKTPAGRTIPESAKVQVFRRGAEPTTATVYWEEFAPADLNAPRADFWNRMPKNQLEKCAEAKALRKAFPGLGDVFTEEEMSQRLSDLTPGGRQIVDQSGFAPSGRAVTYGAQHSLPGASQESAETIAALRAKGLWCEEHQCTRSANHLKECQSGRKEGVPGAAWKREADAKADMPPIDVKSSEASPVSRPAPSGKVPESAYHKENVPPSTKQDPWKYNGIIEIDYSNEAWPIIRGDLGQAVVDLKKACPTMDWGKDEFWHVQQRDLETLKLACLKLNLQVRETFPKPNSAPPTKKEPSREPGVVKGTIESHTEKMTAKKQPMMSVLLKTEKGKVWYSVFDHDLFPFLSKAKGREGEFYVKEGNYPTITGFLKLAGRDFVDGKIPAVPVDREPGRTLFP